MQFKFESGQTVRFTSLDENKIGIIYRASCRSFAAYGNPPYYDVYVVEENIMYQNVDEESIVEVIVSKGIEHEGD